MPVALAAPTPRWIGRRLARVIACAVLAAAALVPLAPTPAAAQDFRVGMSSPPNSMDPHWHNLFSNINVSEHIFEALVKLDADSRIVPGLAERWRVVDDTTWEFTLRAGVRFHDGSPLTVEDVLYSLDRPAQIKGSPGPFTIYTRAITGKEKVNERTYAFSFRPGP